MQQTYRQQQGQYYHNWEQLLLLLLAHRVDQPQPQPASKCLPEQTPPPVFGKTTSQGSGCTGMLVTLSLADAPRLNQLNFQDPATEGAYAALELHNWIGAFLLMVLWLVYVLLGATLLYHTFKTLNPFTLRACIQDYRERNHTVVTEDARLEFA